MQCLMRVRVLGWHLMPNTCQQLQKVQKSCNHSISHPECYIIGEESQDKSRLYQEAPDISNDFHEGFDVEQSDDHVQNSTRNKTGKTATMKEDSQEQQDKEEKEMRRRRYSPRMTLPMQKKEEKEKRPDEAEGAARRVSPKFREEAGEKVSKKDEKMYLFDLA